MPIPQPQLDAIAASTVSAAPEIIIDGAKQAAREVGDTVAIFFDSGADEKYADFLGYNYAPLVGVDLLFHRLLGRIVAHVEPDGTITEIPAPEPLRFTSMHALKVAYNTGAIRSRPAAVAVARLFPCLRRLYPASYDDTAWMSDDLAKAALKLSTGEAECAKFVLLVFNYRMMTDPKAQKGSGWKCGLFNLAEAASHWSREEKAVLTDWINDPLFL